MPLTSRSRAYLGTIFDENWNPEKISTEALSYFIGQQEICPMTKKLHWQIYLELSNGKDIKWMKKHIHATGHFEPRKGSQTDAIKYCSKTDTRKEGCKPIEIGKPHQQGKRSDLDKVGQMINEGKTLKDIAIEHPGTYIKFHKGLEKLKSIISPRRSWKTELIIYWGKSGTGKSRKAWEEYPNAYSKDGSKWWDGYNDQDVVIIDDFEGEIPYREMLKITDRYPYRVQTKGGYSELLVKKIIITSNKHPSEWFQRESITEFERRIDTIKEFE